MSNDITTPVSATKAFTPRPDIDSSSMYGYEAGSAVFKPAVEAAATATPATPEAKSYDVDSSSMRGFTSGGPAVTTP